MHEVFLKENELEKSQKEEQKEPKRSQKRAKRKQAIFELLEQNSRMTQVMLMEELNISRKQVQKDIKEL